jgi:hypothetical protein
MKDFLAYGVAIVITTVDKILCYATASFGVCVGAIIAYRLFLK